MKPTKAQRAMLERMMTGTRIVSDERLGCAWWSDNVCALVNRRAFHCLLRAGWVEGVGKVSGPLVYFGVSDAGRAALEPSA